MDKFIVSARKYRPQTFDTVVGQSHITTTLKNAIQHNQLAHAFLFCGPRGVGKTTCARILAKTINCENLQADTEACNVCPSCRAFNEGGSLNIYELDAASNNSVDDIRDLVEKVRFAPQSGKYKVYIIDEVHMLSTSAFNAFLKTLEEPPPFVIFILATTEKYKILPTILSRCQIFDFKRITTADTIEHLQQIATKEGIEAEKQALQVIAQKSEGCMRDALSILDKIVSFTNGSVTYKNTLEHLNILDHDYFFRLMDFLQHQQLADAMLLYDEINSKGFEGDVVMNGLSEFIRNLLICKEPKAAALLEIVEGMQDKYMERAENMHAAYLVGALNILNEAEINYKMARNKRLHTEITLIKLNFLQQAIQLTNNNGVVAKKKRVEGGIALKPRPVTSVQFIPPTAKPIGESKLFIAPAVQRELKPANVKTTVSITPETTVANVVQEPTSEIISKSKNNSENVSKAPCEKAGNKKDLLAKLKEKYGADYNISEVKEAIPLDMEKLSQQWMAYAEVLRKQQKHSSANTFTSAVLQILEENLFSVTVHAFTQQKFIEQEKSAILNQIQELFFNRSITFTIHVDEGMKEELPLHLKLNGKERFEHMARQNPLLQDLKNRLNLEIDY